MMLRIVMYVLAMIVIWYLLFVSKVSFTYLDYKDYLTTLLTASSMVFTLMGIWIAFLYPNALQRLVNPKKIESVDFSDSLIETRRLESLVASVLRSAFVVMMIMVIYLFKTIIPSFAFYTDCYIQIKSAALSFAIILGALQIESIFYVIYSNVMFINDLHSKREDREADADI